MGLTQIDMREQNYGKMLRTGHFQPKYCHLKLCFTLLRTFLVKFWHTFQFLIPWYLNLNKKFSIQCIFKGSNRWMTWMSQKCVLSATLYCRLPHNHSFCPWIPDLVLILKSHSYDTFEIAFSDHPPYWTSVADFEILGHKFYPVRNEPALQLYISGAYNIW